MKIKRVLWFIFTIYFSYFLVFTFSILKILLWKSASGALSAALWERRALRVARSEYIMRSAARSESGALWTHTRMYNILNA